MTSCSGLPVCLSGVQILPQVRLPHQRLRSPHGDIRSRSNTRRGELGVSDPPRLSSDDCASRNLGTPLTYLSPIENLESDCTSDCSNAGQMRMTWPRLAIVKEMAELDRRRETLKKQHGFRNAAYLEEYIIFREERNSYPGCFSSKSSLENQSECTHCAKAA